MSVLGMDHRVWLYYQRVGWIRRRYVRQLAGWHHQAIDHRLWELEREGRGKGIEFTMTAGLNT